MQSGFSWQDVLKPEVMALAVPILGIAVGGILGAISIISKAILRHRERMAMIERGMHPDLVVDSEEIAEQETVSRS
jgi:hypothetical protein